jgi:hypothetical protein
MRLNMILPFFYYIRFVLKLLCIIDTNLSMYFPLSPPLPTRTCTPTPTPPLPQVHGLREACAAVQAAGKRAVVATPRVFKPEEQRLAQFYLRLRADALLVRSAGLLHQLNAMGGPGEVACFARCIQSHSWGGLRLLAGILLVS